MECVHIIKHVNVLTKKTCIHANFFYTFSKMKFKMHDNTSLPQGVKHIYTAIIMDCTKSHSFYVTWEHYNASPTYLHFINIAITSH